MRVCLISREYPPETGWGGIATFANHLALGLKQIGHDVEVIALAKDKAKTIEQDGILIHRVEPHDIYGNLGAVSLCMPYSRYVLRNSSALWSKFLELHNEKPFDVIDTPELLAEGLIPAVTKAAPLLIRLYTPHSKFIAEKLHNVSPSFDHQFVAMLERIAMLAADVITSPSEDLADFVSQDLNYPREKISIVRNPIDPEQFSPDGPKTLESSDKQLRVLFVGRLEERKGIRYLINAIPKVTKVCSDVKFVIIGDDTNNASGQKSVLAELKEAIKRHNIEDKVEFISRVPLADLPAYYRSADICIVPSVYDNSPYTCLEAMSCGKPVIGTSAGGTQEYIVHGDSGIIIPPRDADSIANALIGLLKDSQERQRLGSNARKRVLDHFQRTKIARQTMELYEEARNNFQIKQKAKLYLKPLEQSLPDADILLFSFDKMLYDLLYLKSWRFRLKHWFNLISKRPKLSAAKLTLAIAKNFAQIFSGPLDENGRSSQGIIKWIDKEIEIRQFGPQSIHSTGHSKDKQPASSSKR